MEVYAPNSFSVVGYAVAVVGVTLALGFWIARRQPVGTTRLIAWTLLPLAVATANVISTDEPAGFRMLILVASGLFAMKAVVAVESRRGGMPALTFGRWLACSAAWFGMRPQLFALRRRPQTKAKEFFLRGLSRTAVGFVLAALASVAWNLLDSRLLSSILLLAGISLILHFAIINIVSAAWRVVGFDCRPLFRAPILSESFSEFWGRRWNLAFSEMTSIALYKPLGGILGRPGALVAAFLFSGLLHEMAISTPGPRRFRRASPLLRSARACGPDRTQTRTTRPRHRWLCRQAVDDRLGGHPAAAALSPAVSARSDLAAPGRVVESSCVSRLRRLRRSRARWTGTAPSRWSETTSSENEDEWLLLFSPTPTSPPPPRRRFPP